MPKVKLLKPVTFNGAIVEAGEEIEVAERSAASLVADKVAEYLGEKTAATVGVSDETVDSGTTATPDEENAPTGESGASNEADAKAAKALDDKYKRDELATAAKDAGVEFPYDAKKAEIIEAVMTAGKAETLLKA